MNRAADRTYQTFDPQQSSFTNHQSAIGNRQLKMGSPTGAPVFSGRAIASPLFSSGSRSPARGTKSRPRADGLRSAKAVRICCFKEPTEGGRPTEDQLIACSRCPRGARGPWVAARKNGRTQPSRSSAASLTASPWTGKIRSYEVRPARHRAGTENMETSPQHRALETKLY